MRMCFLPGSVQLAMANDPYPKYEALPLKDGDGWYAVVTPVKHGVPYELYGFVSETEAKDWIRREMNRKAARES
jgi:hypothetical protein